MDIAPIFLIIASAALIVLTVWLVLVLVQLRRTLQRIDTLVVNTERELTPLLVNLRETSDRLRETAVALQHGMNRAEGLLNAIGAVGDSLDAVNRSLRNGIDRYLGQATAIWSGLKLALRLFRKPAPEEETVEGE